MLENESEEMFGHIINVLLIVTSVSTLGHWSPILGDVFIVLIDLLITENQFLVRQL